MAKKRIALDFDNFADYFPDARAAALVEGKAFPDGIDPDNPVVTEFLAWLGKHNAHSAAVEYTCSRFDAALILEHVAGLRND